MVVGTSGSEKRPNAPPIYRQKGNSYREPNEGKHQRESDTKRGMDPAQFPFGYHVDLRIVSTLRSDAGSVLHERELSMEPESDERKPIATSSGYGPGWQSSPAASSRLRQIQDAIGTHRWALAIALGAFLLRAGVLVSLATYDFPSRWDYGYEYGATARWVALGEGFSSPNYESPRPSALTAPAYVYLIATVFHLFGVYSEASAIILELLQSLFAAGTCLAVYRLGCALFTQRVGLLAAAGVALYPPAIFFSVMRIGPVHLVPLLLALILFDLLKLAENSQRKHLARGGVLMGVTALVEPAVLPFYAVACAWLLIYSRRGFGLALRQCVVLAFLTILCIAPWTIRNYVTFERFVLIKTPMGMNLLYGNNPRGNGVYQNLYDHFLPEEKAYLDQLDEPAQDDIMSSMALEFIRKNPFTFIRLTLRRVAAFWGFYNPYSPSRYNVLRGLAYGCVALAALVGLALARHRKRETTLLLSLFLGYPLVYYVTHVSFYRYRFPVEPFLILLASLAVLTVFERLSTPAQDGPIVSSRGLPSGLDGPA